MISVRNTILLKKISSLIWNSYQESRKVNSDCLWLDKNQSMLFIKNHKILKIVSLQHFSVVPNIDMILQNNTHNSLNSSMITFIISLRDLEMSKLFLIGLLTLSWIMKKIPIMIFSMLEKLMSPVSDSLICLIWVFNKRWHKKQLEKSFNKD